jgi:spore coat protein U-like protein
MRGGGAGGELHYNLYLDPGHTRVWGDGFSNTFTQTVGGGTSRVTIYGSIPARQKVRAAAYQDIMMVTIEW